MMFLSLCFASGDNFPHSSCSRVPAVPQELSTGGGHRDRDEEPELELLWVNTSCGDGDSHCTLVLGSFGHFFLLRAAGGISMGRALWWGWEPASGHALEPLTPGVVLGSAYMVVPLGPQSRARHSL